MWDATQTAILNAVVECAVERGFGGLTTKRVAEVAAVNEVTIFRRFGTKNDLIAAAFQREAAEISRAVGEYTGDVRRDLTRIVTALRGRNVERRALIPQILAELAANPELLHAARGTLVSIGTIVEIIAKHQRAGHLTEEPAVSTYAALVGPILMVGLLDRLLEDEVPFDVEAHVSRFLNGRRPERPQHEGEHS